MYTETDIHKIKCGFVSLYMALVCRKSVLLEKMNIQSIIDLYNLIMFGKGKQCSMFEALKTESWIAEYIPPLTKHHWQGYLIFCKKMITETGGVDPIFHLLVAVFLNIHIVLHPNAEKFKDDDELEKFKTYKLICCIEKGMKHITDPIETIIISKEPSHVEYIPQPKENRCYETIYKQLVEKTTLAVEMENFNIWINDDCDFFDDDEVDFDLSDDFFDDPVDNDIKKEIHIKT